MSCTNPMPAVDFGVYDGKHKIKILPRRVDFSYQDYKDKYGESLLLLPCGSCDACILARRKMWMLRCYAESLYHEDNCFLTLTYSPEYYEQYDAKKLGKKHFQQFVKDLRNAGIKCRYYGCGEEGGETGRFHLHMILFGFKPSDLVPHAKSKSGFWMFKSKFLNCIWNKGFVIVEDFSPENAGYVAGYVDKKYKSETCFVLMSKKPGLGEQYFLDHKDDIYENDSLVTSFGSHVARIPRYFDKLCEKYDKDIQDVKDRRVEQMNIMLMQNLRDHDLQHLEQLQVQESRVFKDKLSKKKRGL